MIYKNKLIIKSHILILGFASHISMATTSDTKKKVEFDASFLRGATDLDLTKFNLGETLPGLYNVDLFLNNKFLGRRSVKFIETAIDGETKVVPFVDGQLLKIFKINRKELPASSLEAIKKIKEGQSLPLEVIFPHSEFDFDINSLRLQLTIPQSYLNELSYLASEDEWVSGVTSAFVNYNLSAYKSSAVSNNNVTSFLSLNAGINIGNWHLRQTSSLNYNGHHFDYRTINTYVTTDILKLKSQISLGEINTDGQFFSSVPVYGALMFSDPRMQPIEDQNYRPLIRGVAKSNAKVTLSQSGKVLYEKTVTPGPFVISDFVPPAYGEDVDVTITESDGSEQKFSVPYTVLPQLLTEGTWRYVASIGQMIDAKQVKLLQFSVQRGMSNNLTAYTGALVSQNYLSGILGFAVSTWLGAFSVDGTYVRANIGQGMSKTGQSYRVSFNKVLPVLQTNLTVAGYRYSSKDFLTINDYAQLRYGESSSGFFSSYQAKNRFDFSVAQPFFNGNLFFTGSVSNYWDNSPLATQIQFGYSNSFSIRSLPINYSVYFSRSKTADNQTDNQIYLSLFFPLGNANANVAVTRDSGGHVNTNATISGILNNGRVNYSLTGINNGGYTSGSGGIGISTSYAALGFTVSGNRDNQQYSASAQGGVVLHSGGINFSNQGLYDAAILVEAKNAEGARVNNIKIASNGYAVIPFASSYMYNPIEISTEGLPLGTDFDTTSLQIAPRANALALAKFSVTKSIATLLEIHLPSGYSVPFGASLLDDQGQQIGMASNNGRIFVKGLPEESRLYVRWGKKDDEACYFDYTNNVPNSSQARYTLLNVTCNPPQDGMMFAGREFRLASKDQDKDQENLQQAQAQAQEQEKKDIQANLSDQQSVKKSAALKSKSASIKRNDLNKEASVKRNVLSKEASIKRNNINKEASIKRNDVTKEALLDLNKKNQQVFLNYKNATQRIRIDSSAKSQLELALQQEMQDNLFSKPLKTHYGVNLSAL